ncbi:hypothetical protein [Campylobacter lanienae]|uniref:hypothetical protein n=1 Tax=Campylobacter lanienae TaxID=75658 RepID=UPI0024328686|nr:hypothetical protein [Campylobacter lanienae]MDD5785991.1 hypothetical protein [Campylobacter lanienae]
MDTIIEFLPIAIIAIGCGIMKLTEEVKSTLREQAHAFVGGILLCVSIFLSLGYFNLDYGIRVGVSALITFIGLDKAIEYFNKIRGSN